MEKTYTITRSNEEWQRLLTPAQYEVVRLQGTETPGSCALLRFKPVQQGTRSG